ncbi:hypothetical protein [Falsiroseomonas stagni]|uniref:hypothetical protein n=1 Tax=Falsiroseomonas stagni TaxID=484882 RepID=UPI001113F64D|nr:hypothetical protein [Falsiroseomonas stagni]
MSNEPDGKSEKTSASDIPLNQRLLGYFKDFAPIVTISTGVAISAGVIWQFSGRIERAESRAEFALSGVTRSVAIAFAANEVRLLDALNNTANANFASSVNATRSRCLWRPAEYGLARNDEPNTYRCFVDLVPPLQKTPTAIFVANGRGRSDRITILPADYVAGQVVLTVRHNRLPNEQAISWDFSGHLVFLFD